MINYCYETHENENDKTWHVEIRANSDRIGYYEDCLTQQEAIARAESFIDGVKFARCE
jgi:GH25 family lysozyme M1 (1,4-beta-N-acetylmuramidase)